MSESRRYVQHDSVKQNISKILELKKLGIPNTRIAKRFGVSSSFINELVSVTRPTYSSYEPRSCCNQ